MWSKKDCARILAILMVGLLCFPPVARPSVGRRPSPARWLWQHTRARRGELVGVECLHTDHGYGCKLTIQASPRFRECWFVALIPHHQTWHVRAVVAITDPQQCPVLRMRHHGTRALTQ